MDVAKIFWMHNDALESLFIHPDYFIAYSPGKETRAPAATKLFAFVGEQTALDFLSPAAPSSRCAIWRCECEYFVPYSGRLVVPAYATDLHDPIRLFWEWFNGGADHTLFGSIFPEYTTMTVPIGTVFCDSLTPVERLI